jgi:copper/silver efflux system protein
VVMRYQGINANIMSLGGIAIAIGAMVDAAVVMIENAHKKLEAWRHANGREPQGAERARLMGDAATEVGPALFFSLLIITLSFVPIFALQAQEGRLFSPLAYTKTWAMAAAAGLSVTLVPVLMVYFIRGRIADEARNPLNRLFIAAYRPLIGLVLRFPWATLAVTLLAVALSAYPARQLGSEFMPPLDEGDMLYMPSALPGLSAGKAAQLLQQTDRIIKQFPEVERVFGKMGRAETATDPAPLEMVETTVRFKPEDQWRPGMTREALLREMDAALKIPGLANIWVPPIRNRIDMLATGIKSPVGVKVAGADIRVLEEVATRIEQVVREVPGAASVLAERLSGGRYVDVTIDRLQAARYGLSIADVQSLVALAVGGENIGETVEGLQRFPINVRYPRELRDSPEKIGQLPIVTGSGAQIPLSAVARIDISDGPPMLRSENARLSGWVYVDIRGRDLGSFVADAKRAVAEQVRLPPGYSVTWSGQFEYLERAANRMKVVIPFTLAIIFVLLFMTFRNFTEPLLIMATLPFAMVGGVWLMFLLGHDFSIASAVGFIALAGVAAEFGIVMLIYLDQAVARRRADGTLSGMTDLKAAIFEGAVLRVRPKAMTVAVIIAGLLPIMLGSGTGSEVMQRIAAPMVGGMITAPLLSMLVLPAAYLIRYRRALRLGAVVRSGGA